MKAIIAGGRDYTPQPSDDDWLDRLISEHGITEIVSGGARGADAYGEAFARCRGIKLTIVSAEWKRYGKSAGAVRNELMAGYVSGDGIVILFPGGRGTDHMGRCASKMGIPVISRIPLVSA